LFRRQTLDKLNSFEKNAFLKIIDNIITENPKNLKEIDQILSDTDKDLKNVDNINVAGVFSLIEDEFSEYIRAEFSQVTSQLDILADILIRDGNCIMSREWFDKLYEGELKLINSKLKDFKLMLEGENDRGNLRVRDYKIYSKCLYTAFWNDMQSNQDCKITNDEQSILITLSNQLELSQEEAKLIKYSILPIEKQEIDKIISELRNKGIIFYSKKNFDVFIPDAIVRVIRRLRGKEVADKHFRRVLRHIKEPQINLVARKHNIDRKKSRQEKIKEIINEGISGQTGFTDMKVVKKLGRVG